MLCTCLRSYTSCTSATSHTPPCLPPAPIRPMQFVVTVKFSLSSRADGHRYFHCSCCSGDKQQLLRLHLQKRVPKCICFMMRFSCWPRPALLSYTKNGQNEAIAKETRQRAVMSAATKKGTSQSFVPCKLKCVLGAFDFNEIHATTTTTTTRERTTQTSWACLACQEKGVGGGCVFQGKAACRWRQCKQVCHMQCRKN